ncbi:TlpA family protein disulfide reductase [Kineobactrum sediminis]|uniref:TlpA family protein disulfide reductase n=1 Tax=Kineobactrum sediminis TaxID=1905677 RepID=UPI001F4D7701|nr:TlpA disulfide reductase family protein [Kineobactrum sediminis]
MKSLRVATALLLLLALAGCEPEPRDNAALFKSLHGQWIVINYWAQWCKPCIKEIPELNALDENHADITVLGVNYDGATGDDLAAQIATFGVSFQTLAEDPAALLGVPRPIVLPTTLIINPQGELVNSLVGPQTLESLRAATVEQEGPAT